MKFAPYAGEIEWEGLVLPGIERGSSEFRQVVAEPPAPLNHLVSMCYVFSWNLPAPKEAKGLMVPTACHSMGLYLSKTFTSPIELFWPTSVATPVTLRGEGTIAGIQFRPGAYVTLFPQAKKQTSHRYPLSQDWPEHPLPQLTQASEEDLINWLTQVMGTLETRKPKTEDYQILTRAVARPETSGENITVKDLVNQAAVSDRTLQRIFQKLLGLTPKNFLRVKRFHDTINFLNRNRTELLAQVALEQGFFDEAHLINEIRTLTGTSPLNFKKFT